MNVNAKSHFFLFFIALFATVFRYIDYLNINVFIMLYLFYVVLFTKIDSYYKIPKVLIYLLVFFFYLYYMNLFFEVRFNSLLLFSASLFSIMIGYFIVLNNQLITFIKYLFIVEITHMIFAFLQKYFNLEILITSFQFGYIDTLTQLNFSRPSGLSFIPADFHLYVVLILSYFIYFKQIYKLLFFTILLCFINFSKILVPMVILCYFLYHIVLYCIKRNKVLLATFLFFIAIVFINFLGMGYGYYEYLKDPNFPSTFSARGAFLVYTMEILKNNFFFGIGLDNFKSLVPEIASSLGIYAHIHSPHNVWLKIFSELGFIGFILYLIFIYKVVYLLLNRISMNYIKKRNNFFEILILNTIFLVLVNYSFHNFHFYNDLYLYLGIAIGLIYSKKDVTLKLLKN